MIFPMYGNEVIGTEYVLLEQNKINWVDSVKHLDNYFNTQMSDSNDCMMKRSTFIGSVNKLMANFSHLQASVLSNIFKTFCFVIFWGLQFGISILLALVEYALLGISECAQY